MSANNQAENNGESPQTSRPSGQIQQERLRALGQMARGMVHDFNNALQPILFASSLLLEDDSIQSDSKAWKTQIRHILAAAEEASETLQRLARFYKPVGVGGYTRVDLNGLVEEALEQTRPYWSDEASARGYTVTLHKDLGPDCHLYGHRDALRKLVEALIVNGVEALDHDGFLAIRTRRREDRTALVISDTGRGMTEDAITHGFEPFYTTKQQLGAGLGLSMVYGIAQRHQGQINIDSTVGQGASISISFPYAPETPQKEKVPVSAPHPPAVERGACAILLAEDDPQPRELMHRILGMKGHRVEDAASGQAAWTLLEKNRYDVLITDHTMPGLSGVELATKAKKIYPDMPIIMLTGFSNSDETRHHHPDGIDYLLCKPVSGEQLLEAVNAVLSGAPE